uniref:Uncharacterized protein n=1 Tax=Anopheles atroparvus TaxID=41427 RepID=A0A182IW21_ANOAO
MPQRRGQIGGVVQPVRSAAHLGQLVGVEQPPLHGRRVELAVCIASWSMASSSWRLYSIGLVADAGGIPQKSWNRGPMNGSMSARLLAAPAPPAPPSAAATVAADAVAGRFIMALSSSGANWPIWPRYGIHSIWLKAAVVAASMSPASPDASSELIIGFCLAACAESVCLSVSRGLAGVGVTWACDFLLVGAGGVDAAAAAAAAATEVAVTSREDLDLSFTSSSCVCRIVSSCCSEITSMSGSCRMLGNANASGSRSSGRVVSSSGISRAGDASTAFSRSLGTRSGSGTFQAGFPTSSRSWVSGSGSLPDVSISTSRAESLRLLDATLGPLVAAADVVTVAGAPEDSEPPPWPALLPPDVCCSGSILIRFALGSLLVSSWAVIVICPPWLAEPDEDEATDEDESRFASSEQLTVGLADFRHLPKSSGSFCCTVAGGLLVVVVATELLLVLVAVLVVVPADPPPPPLGRLLFATAATAAAACDISASITLDAVELFEELEPDMDFGCRKRSGEGGTAGSPLGWGDCIASELCETGRGEGERLRLRQLRSLGSSSCWHESGDITIGASAGSSFTVDVVVTELLALALPSLSPPPAMATVAPPELACSLASVRSLIVIDSSSSSVLELVVVVVADVAPSRLPPPLLLVATGTSVATGCTDPAAAAADAPVTPAPACFFIADGGSGWGANGFGRRSSTPSQSIPPPSPCSEWCVLVSNRSPVSPSISPASLNDRHLGEVLRDSPSREMMSATGSGSSSTSSSSSSFESSSSAPVIVLSPQLAAAATAAAFSRCSRSSSSSSAEFWPPAWFLLPALLHNPGRWRSPSSSSSSSSYSRTSSSSSSSPLPYCHRRRRLLSNDDGYVLHNAPDPAAATLLAPMLLVTHTSSSSISTTAPSDDGGASAWEERVAAAAAAAAAPANAAASAAVCVCSSSSALPSSLSPDAFVHDAIGRSPASFALTPAELATADDDDDGASSSTSSTSSNSA